MIGTQGAALAFSMAEVGQGGAGGWQERGGGRGTREAGGVENSEEDGIAPPVFSFHTHLNLQNFTWINFAKLVQERSGDIAVHFTVFFPLYFRLLVFVSILPFQWRGHSQRSQPTSQPAARFEVATFHLELMAGRALQVTGASLASHQ